MNSENPRLADMLASLLYSAESLPDAWAREFYATRDYFAWVARELYVHYSAVSN